MERMYMNCREGCTHLNHAIEIIRKSRPEHLILLGSCCSVRGLLGAAPRVTVLGDDVGKLAAMVGSAEMERIQILATSVPSLSLSSDPADMIYLCENADALGSRDFAELAAVLKPGGCLLLSTRYYQGDHPPADWLPGKALAQWVRTFNDAGLNRVDSLGERILVVSYRPNGEMIYSVSEGLLKASKGGN